MGMDVLGKNPTNKKGEYFRNNVWWWHPLWDYCLKIAPEICGKVSGHLNDGDGLNDEEAKQLAEILKSKIQKGYTKEYEKNYETWRKSVPDETCSLCNGTGNRHDLKPEEWKRECNGCNGCNGTGKKRAFETYYRFSEKNVKEFADFCRTSGGFQIY